MSGIRSKNTKPEITIRKALHKKGFRFRLHSSKLPGTPDLVFQKYKTVIFTHGCFWHNHDCVLFKWPSSRPDFWKNKLSRNKIKDRKSLEKLLEQNWRVLVIWECAFKGPEKLSLEEVVSASTSFLTGNKKFFEIKG